MKKRDGWELGAEGSLDTRRSLCSRMIIKTSSEARQRLGETLDMAQREPVAITRHGQIVAYVSPQLMEELRLIKQKNGPSRR